MGRFLHALKGLIERLGAFSSYEYQPVSLESRKRSAPSEVLEHIQPSHRSYAEPRKRRKISDSGENERLTKVYLEATNVLIVLQTELSEARNANLEMGQTLEVAKQSEQAAINARSLAEQEVQKARAETIAACQEAHNWRNNSDNLDAGWKTKYDAAVGWYEGDPSQLAQDYSSLLAERNTALVRLQEIENTRRDEVMEDASQSHATNEELAEAIANGDSLEKQLQQQQSENRQLCEELERLKASPLPLDSGVRSPPALPSPPEEPDTNNGGISAADPEVDRMKPPVGTKHRAANPLNRDKSDRYRTDKSRRAATGGISKSSKAPAVSETGKKQAQKSNVWYPIGHPKSTKRSAASKATPSTPRSRIPRSSQEESENLKSKAAMAPIKVAPPKTKPAKSLDIDLPDDASEIINMIESEEDYDTAVKQIMDNSGDYATFRKSVRFGLLYKKPGISWTLFAPHGDTNGIVCMTLIKMSDVFDTSKNRLLPAFDKVRFVQEEDYEIACLLAQLPSVHMQALHAYENDIRGINVEDDKEDPEAGKIMEEFKNRGTYKAVGRAIKLSTPLMDI